MLAKWVPMVTFGIMAHQLMSQLLESQKSELMMTSQPTPETVANERLLQMIAPQIMSMQPAGAAGGFGNPQNVTSSEMLVGGR